MLEELLYVAAAGVFSRSQNHGNITKNKEEYTPKEMAS